MTVPELQAKYEAEVSAMFDNCSRAKMLIAYEYLYAYGCRMELIEHSIAKALKNESGMLMGAGK